MTSNPCIILTGTSSSLSRTERVAKLKAYMQKTFCLKSRKSSFVIDKEKSSPFVLLPIYFMDECVSCALHVFPVCLLCYEYEKYEEFIVQGFKLTPRVDTDRRVKLQSHHALYRLHITMNISSPPPPPISLFPCPVY
jgi:hypothetical protein